MLQAASLRGWGCPPAPPQGRAVTPARGPVSCRWCCVGLGAVRRAWGRWWGLLLHWKILYLQIIEANLNGDLNLKIESELVCVTTHFKDLGNPPLGKFSGGLGFPSEKLVVSHLTEASNWEEVELWCLLCACPVPGERTGNRWACPPLRRAATWTGGLLAEGLCPCWG